MNEESQFSAFISHASEDREKAEEICASLEERGLRCWVAPRDVRAGREFGAEIIHGIEHSRCLVLVLSEAANDSVYVRREVERAVSKRKPVFPIRIEEVLPSPSLELFVSSTHWIDAWSGSLIAHANRLAEELDNPDQIREASKFSAQAYRRKRLPAWIGFGVAFLAIVAAVVIGVSVAINALLHPTDPEEAHRLATKAMEIDQAAVGRDSFAVAIEPFSLDPSRLVLAVRVVKPPKSGAGTMGLNGATVEYALDGSSTYQRLGPILNNRVQASPGRDEGALRRAREVSIRIRGIMGQELGPFTYAVDGRTAGIAAVRRQSGDRPLQQKVMLINEQMQVKVGELLPIARCLWVGSDPANLSMRIPVAGLEDRLEKAGEGNRHWRNDIANIPVLPGKPAHVRIEFLDGTKSPVEVFENMNKHQYRGGRTGLTVKAREAGGPDLHVVPKDGARPIGRAGEYVPALWIEAEEVLYSFDGGGGIPAKRHDHRYGVGHYFSFEEPLQTGTLTLEVKWADGSPPKTFHYDLPDPSAVLIENAMMHFQRREVDLMAVRFAASDETFEDERSFLQARDRVRQKLLNMWPNFMTPDAPVLRLGISRNFPEAPMPHSWLAVREMHYGTAPGKLTETMEGPITPDDLLRERKVDENSFFRADLPVETPALYYKFQYRDGSESAEKRLRIEQLELPVRKEN